MSRQIVLDTETTGLEVSQKHRVIEIGCVELKNRRPTGNNFHRYVNPQREIDAGAEQVHGITSQFLADKPLFGAFAREFWEYLHGAELIIHNAEFDLGFLNYEFELASVGQRLHDVCSVIDTVTLARKLHPGQKVNLDALCKRYNVDNSNRDFHGALLDARLLADVYLAMTGGQSRLTLDAEQSAAGQSRFVELLGKSSAPLPVLAASDEELAAHRARMAEIGKKAGKLVWMEESA
ncbi:MAG TPA: DNA polymerase III subunit epsilon [Nevskiaceae bacterium]|nr:DNA polymerase III subunit epsilon [Nevskiaceae bacterium]